MAKDYQGALDEVKKIIGSLEKLDAAELYQVVIEPPRKSEELVAKYVVQFQKIGLGWSVRVIGAPANAPYAVGHMARLGSFYKKIRWDTMSPYTIELPPIPTRKDKK